MCKTDRESYEKYWDDISPFIKFGCIKDSKFSEKLHDYILFKDVDNKYLTLKDCIEQNKKKIQLSLTIQRKKMLRIRRNAEKKEPEKTNDLLCDRSGTAEPVHQYVQRSRKKCSYSFSQY